MAKKNEATATPEHQNQDLLAQPSAAQQSETAKAAAKENLESLAVLADRHRVPAWQEAALCRFMDWQDGKMVTDADYVDALNKLKNRRIGGGRA